MCFVKNKWTKFTPTQKYLSVVEGLTSVAKLHEFIQQFKRKEDKTDYWQTPEETLNLLTYDCDDTMRFTVDVLKRVIKIGAKGVISSGYDKTRWGNKIWNVKCHAITVFPYKGKFALFSNRELKTGYDSYIDACKYTFPDGLKNMIVRDWQGKILSKKNQFIGTF